MTSFIGVIYFILARGKSMVPTAQWWEKTMRLLSQFFFFLSLFTQPKPTE